MRIKRNVLLLGVLLSLNLIFGGLLFYEEHSSHSLLMMLERRGYVLSEASEHPDYWARRGWVKCLEQIHDTFDIAFYGNSLTYGGNFQSMFPDKKIINLGLCGDNIIGCTQRVDGLVACNPQKVFVLIGINDIYTLPMKIFEERYNNLLNIIKEKLPNTNIYLQSLLPVNNDMMSRLPSNEKICAANRIIKKIANGGGKIYRFIFTI